MKDTPQAAAAREKHKIPEIYHLTLEGQDGILDFDFCDSTIQVHPDGKVTETHMALNSSATRHEFMTFDWKA